MKGTKTESHPTLSMTRQPSATDYEERSCTRFRCADIAEGDDYKLNLSTSWNE